MCVCVCVCVCVREREREREREAMTLRITTFSIMIFSIILNEMRHSPQSTYHNVWRMLRWVSHISFVLSVTHRPFMLSATAKTLKLRVFLLNVNMLSVMAPWEMREYTKNFFFQFKTTEGEWLNRFNGITKYGRTCDTQNLDFELTTLLTSLKNT